MSSKIELLGTDELVKQIRQKLGAGARRVENHALRKAAVPIVEETKARVDHSKRNDVHLKDDIKASGVRRKNGIAYIAIGASKKTSWRVHFLEFGTAKMQPKPFMKPGFDAGKERALQIIKAEFIKGLKE